MSDGLDALTEEQVDRLLHDALRAKGGAAVARMMRDKASANSLMAKYTQLYGEALALDPERKAPCWECDE